MNLVNQNLLGRNGLFTPQMVAKLQERRPPVSLAIVDLKKTISLSQFWANLKVPESGRRNLPGKWRVVGVPERLKQILCHLL
jgi:hypothetical protein